MENYRIYGVTEGLLSQKQTLCGDSPALLTPHSLPKISASALPPNPQSSRPQLG